MVLFVGISNAAFLQLAEASKYDMYQVAGPPNRCLYPLRVIV